MNTIGNIENVGDGAVSNVMDLDIEFIKKRVTVQPPYFAFDRLYQHRGDDWDIYGEFCPEQCFGAEDGIVSIAEAGRHLAILGTCAASLYEHEDEAIYYLATHAKGNVYHHEIPGKRKFKPEWLTARARITGRHRKTLQAHTELVFENTAMMSIKVEYCIIPYKLFSRVFSKNHHPGFGLEETGPSPYRRPMALDFEVPGDQELTAHSADDSHGQCLGHFTGYPMWPVAIIVYSAGQVVAELMKYLIKNDSMKYRIHDIEVDAFQLTPVSVRLSFHAKLLKTSEDGLFSVSCRVVGGGQDVAKIDMQCFPGVEASL